MGFSEDQILLWFQQYAYQPYLVYFAVVALMVASSFGLPVPEEVTLVGLGLVCYIGSRPDLYPPPSPGAPVVEVEVAALVALLAVFLSDYLVFSLGKFFGVRLMKTRFFAKNQDSFDKVSSWVKRYGMWAAGIFRFTPGLRFPGHFSCGMLGLKQSQFFLVDGLDWHQYLLYFTIYYNNFLVGLFPNIFLYQTGSKPTAKLSQKRDFT